MSHLKELRTLLSDTTLWIRQNPGAAFFVALVSATIIYFYGFLAVYGHGKAIWPWAWLRFLPQYNQEHSKLIPLIVLFLLWHHRAALRTALKRGDNVGLPFIAFGILCYLIGARTLQARIALFGFPFLLFGLTLFLWGRKVARILLFPITLLFFMIPLGAIEQMTFRLQFLIIAVVKVLGGLFGIPLYSIGTSLSPVSGNWGFDIAEGCSGIRSLIAMIMITAIYAHLCEPVFWKKLTLLCFSILFAILGNAARIFTIVLIAKLGFPRFAGGLYHDWSSQLIFFPVALLSMVGFSKLLQADFHNWRTGDAWRVKEKTVYDY